MAAMKRTALVLSVLWVLAGTAPASAAFLGENPRLGESFPNAGIGHIAGDVSRELPPGSGGSCLERPAECFVAPDAPTESYNRLDHYGRTPTAADRQALGAQPGQVVDHEPPLVQRYYEGDPATGRKRG